MLSSGKESQQAVGKGSGMNDRNHVLDIRDARRRGFGRTLFHFLVGVVWLLSVCASEAQDRLCVPSTTWFGTPAITLDGAITSPAEWQGSFQTDLGPTAAPDVVIRGMRDTTSLRLFIQANNLDALFGLVPVSNFNPYASNLVVLTFDDGVGTNGVHNYEQIQINPVVNNAHAPYSGNSGTIQYWSGTGPGAVSWTIFNPTGAVHHPAWISSSDVQAAYSKDATGSFPYHWALEMDLPFQSTTASGLQIPSSGFFQLYVDVFRVVGTGGMASTAKFQQTSWPPSQPETGCPSGSNPAGCNPNAQTPDTSGWGFSTVDSTQTCSLVNIDRISVSNATNTDGTLIDALTANTFKAQVTNSVPPASTGLPDTAKQVSATFSIWNNGIPSLAQWQQVPTTNNPTAAADLPPGDTNLSPDSWTVAVADQPKYDPNASNSHPHQCIQVLLTSNDKNTSFTNNPAFQNMDFVHASKFERTAEIGAQGYPPRPDNADGTHYGDQLFDLQILTREEVFYPKRGTSKYNTGAAVTVRNPWDVVQVEEGQVISQLTWIAHGCRHTGRFMFVDKHPLELCDPVGAFGYVIRHVGTSPVRNWHWKLAGVGVVAGEGNTYQVHVAQDGAATVTTFADPEEEGTGGRFALFFDFGGNLPQGTFGQGFNNGFSLNAGLEYQLNSYASIEGIFGYHHFPVNSIAGTITTDLNIYQFSANAKLYLKTIPWGSRSARLFVNFGPGGYKFSSADTYFGGNVGGGLLFNLTPRVGLQGSYNFHAINTPVEATKFSTFQGGIRFVF